MLPSVSRWVRENSIAHLLPWRLQAPLERATVQHAYPKTPGPLHWQLAASPADVVLLFGGDLALHDWQLAGDSSAVFGGLDALTSSVHGCFLNLESQLTERTIPAGIIGSSLRADPSALEVLSRLRLTAVCCANNHCLDFGSEGLSESVDRLESAGIGVTGVTGPGRDGGHVVEVRGVRIGLLAFADDWHAVDAPAVSVGPLPHDPTTVRERIAAMRPTVDLVVVQLHWGFEYSMYPMLSQRNLARQYAEAGAGLVLCHHAHVPMGVERWGESVIAHGLGNFYFGRSSGEHHPFRHASFLLRVGLAGGVVVEADAVPVHTDRNGRVVLPSSPMARVINRSLAYLSGRLDDDWYLNAVEQSLVAQNGCLVFLDLARRIAEGDQRGVLERVRFLELPRQQLLRASMIAAGGLVGDIGSLLDRAREWPEALHRSDLAAEIAAQQTPVQRYLETHREKGRIP